MGCCQHGSAGKGACFQAWLLEFNTQDSHGERRKLTPTSCSLTCIYAHTQNKEMKANTKFKETKDYGMVLYHNP